MCHFFLVQLCIARPYVHHKMFAISSVCKFVNEARLSLVTIIDIITIAHNIDIVIIDIILYWSSDHKVRVPSIRPFMLCTAIKQISPDIELLHLHKMQQLYMCVACALSCSGGSRTHHRWL